VDGPPLWGSLDAAHIFERVMVMVSWRWARSLESLLGTQRLQPQLLLLVCVALVAALWPVYQRGLGAARISSTDTDPVFAAVWIVGIACALGCAYLAKYHRLAAVILGGGAGLAICITFVWLSAIDLALTQLLVEIVTTVLLLLGLRWLPKRLEVIDAAARARTIGSTRRRRLRDLAVAVMSGSGLSILAYSVMTSPTPNSISKFFLARAYTDGGGTNVVNVILVDFRGFDTLGEITVLGVVALTVFALLRRFRPAPDSVGIPEQQTPRNAQQDDHSQPGAEGGFLPVPAVIVQLLFPFMAIMAVFLFLRGHDLPGGGFIAGITMAIALILQYMAGGIRMVETRLRISPLRWISFGLLTAACAGAAPWLFSRPFLTSYANYAELPLIGAVPTASAVIFDLGVFLLVVGATALMLVALAHQSIRSHRVARSSATAAPTEDT
jgi:multicomponent K+:H+ antiporter subunit A